MKASSIMFTLLAACAGMLACSESPTALDGVIDSHDVAPEPAYAMSGTVMTPIAFVTTDNGQGWAIPGFPVMA